LGAAMVILVPGYAVVALLFPLADELDGIERIALSCGLSVVISIVVTLGLAEFHVRLDAQSDALSVGGTVFALLAGALWRRSRISASKRYVPHLPLGAGPVLACCFAVSVGLATWWIVGTNLGTVEPEFYISDSHGMLAGYPERVRVGTLHFIHLHVANPTGQPVTYGVRVRDGVTVVARSMVKVGARTNCVRRIGLPSSGPPRDVRLTFTFFRHNHMSGDLRLTYRLVS